MVRPAAGKPKTTSNRLLIAMGIRRTEAGKEKKREQEGERKLWKAPFHSFPGVLLLLWFHHLLAHCYPGEHIPTHHIPL